MTDDESIDQKCEVSWLGSHGLYEAVSVRP